MQDDRDNSTYVYGHPKMKKLEEVIVRHFETFNKSGKFTDSCLFLVSIDCLCVLDMLFNYLENI